MTPADAVRVLNSITFGWPLKALDLRVRARLVEDDRAVDVEIAAQMPHRDTGKVGPTGRNLRISDVELVAFNHGDEVMAKLLVERVRHAARDWLLHELDESLLVGGRRAFDPHPVPGPAEQWAAAKGMIPPPNAWYARNGPDGRGFQSRAAVIRRGFAAVRKAIERRGTYVIVVEPDAALVWSDGQPSIPTTFRERCVQPTDDLCEVAAWLLALQGNILQEARA